MKKLRYFDCNCMMGRIAEERLFFETKEELLKEMNYYGIEKALVYSSIAYQHNTEYGNKLLKEEIRNTKRLLPVAVVVPWYGPDRCLSEQTEKILKKDAYGVRLFPQGSNFELSKLNMSEVFGVINKIKLPVFINYLEIQNLEIFKETVYSYPKVPFVIAWPRYTLARKLCGLFDSFKNIYVDISNFCSYQAIEYMGDKFGYNRFLFGSNWPYSSVCGPMMRIIYGDMSDKDKEKIAYYNLKEIIDRISR